MTDIDAVQADNDARRTDVDAGQGACEQTHRQSASRLLAIASTVAEGGDMAGSKVGSIGEYIREQRTRAKISLRQLADVSGISNPYLSQIERGLRKPSAEILQQIAKGLRISAEALYVQAGILEAREAESDVQAAVRADLVLTERQKQVLLDIYDSFRKENAATEQQATEQQAAAQQATAQQAAARPAPEEPATARPATQEPSAAQEEEQV
ncbi:helix-turn-helix domain-containing protein [Actinomadura logoneensis]|uniref:helix-turn-helix domain-containing protein n=1 Tax=Actinomadura logoneensis TaxID=2293572 RepID=UPI002E263F3E